MTATILKFPDMRRRRAFALVNEYHTTFKTLAVGEKVELLLTNGSTCAGWKSSDCHQETYWANDIMSGGFRQVEPIGWRLLPVSMRG